MTPFLFEKTIGTLVRKYEIVNLESFLQKENTPTFSRPVATILFDDGYKDNIEYAAPILKKYSCTASFYVVTDCINRDIPTWTYLVDYAFQRTKNETIYFHPLYVPDDFKKISLNDKSKISKIKPWMKKLSNTMRVEIVSNILDQCKDVKLPDNKMMSWDDVRQLKVAGFTIGSHSHTHPMLAALESEKEIEDELHISAAILQKELGEKPLTISYPIGSFDERVIQLSKSAGYQFGLAVKQKAFNYAEDSLLTIPRIELYQESWWKVQLRINGMFEKLKTIWR